MRLIIALFAMTTLAHAQPTLHVLWDRSGETDSSAYGYKILPLGDQNDDGYADWAVYAQGNTGTWHGRTPSRLEFFHGGNPISTDPYFVFREDSLIYNPLWYADAVGDLNGDSFQDWMVDFSLLNNPNSWWKGIFFGGHGPATAPDFVLNLRQGVGIYPVGDFNGDGFDDIYSYDFYANIGKMFYGGNPMDTVPDWVLSHPPQGILQSIPFAAGDFNGGMGRRISCASI